MSDTVSKNVQVAIKIADQIKTDPFRKLQREAEMSSQKIAELEGKLKRVQEQGNGSMQKLQSGATASLGGLAGELKKTDKGFTNLTIGATGLIASLGMMEGPVGKSAMKAMMLFQVVHSGALFMKGLASMTSVAGSAMTATIGPTLAATSANNALAASAQRASAAQGSLAASSTAVAGANTLAAGGSAAASVAGTGGMAVGGAGIAGTGVIGAAGGALSAAAVPLAVVAGAVALVGSVAVLASPKLQEKLGNAITGLGESAEKTAERLNNSSRRMEEIGRDMAFGFAGTMDAKIAEAKRMAALPFQEKIEALRFQQSDIRAQQYAQSKVAADPFETERKLRDRQELMEGQFRNATTPGIRGLNTAEIRAQRAELTGMVDKALKAGTDYQLSNSGVSKEHERQMRAVNEQIFSTGDVLRADDAKIADLQRRVQLTKQLGEYNRQIADAQISARAARKEGNEVGYFRGAYEEVMSAATSKNPTGPAEQAFAAAQRFEGRASELEAHRRNMPQFEQATDNQLAEAMAERERHNQRLLELQQKRLDLQKEINKANIDDLKKMEESFHSQKKGLEDLIRTEQRRLDGEKSRLGLMNAEQKMTLLQVAEKMKSGNLSGMTKEEQDFGMSNPLTAPWFERKGFEMAQADPMVKQIYENLRKAGVDPEAQLKGLKEEHAFKAEMEVKLQNEVTHRVRLDEQSMAAESARVIIPTMEKMFQDWGRQVDLAMKQKIADMMRQMDQQQRQQQANRAAAAG